MTIRDIIDEVAISPDVDKHWRDFAERVAQQLTQSGEGVESISDEQAVEMPDGKLCIYVEIKLASGVELIARRFYPRSAWDWMPKA